MTSSPPYNQQNGRVTNAILSTKLDALTEEVRAMCLKTERRITNLEEKHDIRLGTLEAHCHENENQISRLDERQKATTSVLGGLTFIGSAIAAAIGSLVK